MCYLGPPAQGEDFSAVIHYGLSAPTGEDIGQAPFLSLSSSPLGTNCAFVNLLEEIGVWQTLGLFGSLEKGKVSISHQLVLLSNHELQHFCTNPLAVPRFPETLSGF